MANYRAQILTAKPADEVFAYVADFSNAAEWDPGVAAATRDGEGPVTVGETFALEVKVGKRTMRMDYEVTELQSPRTIVLRSETERLLSEDTITVRDTPAGTVLDYNADLTIKGPLGAFDVLLGLAFKRIGDRAADGLREHVT